MHSVHNTTYKENININLYKKRFVIEAVNGLKPRRGGVETRCKYTQQFSSDHHCPWFLLQAKPSSWGRFNLKKQNNLLTPIGRKNLFVYPLIREVDQWEGRIFLFRCFASLLKSVPRISNDYNKGHEYCSYFAHICKYLCSFTTRTPKP